MITDTLSRGIKTFRYRGTKPLFKGIVSWAYRRTLRKMLPKVTHLTIHGVVLNVPLKILDPWLLDDQLMKRRGSQRGVEGAIVKAHRKYTRPGNDVVIVGGGYGISLGVSAFLTTSEGEITVYEADPSKIRDLSAVAELNDVQNVTIENVIVGEVTVDLDDSIPVLPASALPDCDVLELDCEGAEYDIITEMDISPAHIIVELHPNLLEVNATEVLDALRDRGYSIVCRYGHEGTELSPTEFDQLLKKTEELLSQYGDYPGPLPNDFGLLESKPMLPPVIVATRDDVFE